MIEKALANLVPNADWVAEGDTYAGIQWLDEVKTKKTELETILRSISDERNDLKNQNIKLNNEEEKRKLDSKKEIEALLTGDAFVNISDTDKLAMLQ